MVRRPLEVVRYRDGPIACYKQNQDKCNSKYLHPFHRKQSTAKSVKKKKAINAFPSINTQI